MEIIDLESNEFHDELELKLFNLTRTRNSLSLFDLVIQAEESNEKLKESEYEERLKNELSEWFQLIKKTKSQFTKQSESKNKIEIDKDILLPEQIQYLEAMPNFQKFVDDSKEFQIKAFNYLQEYAETDEMKNELAKYCMEKLEQIAVNNSEKYIYG